MQDADLATPDRQKQVDTSRSAWIALGSVASGVFLVALDGTITSVANPRLAQDLSASLGQLQWVTNAYLLGLGAVLILAGRLGDRFGRRKVFLVGIAGFVASSAAVGLATSIEMVIAARGFQGLFGALIVTNALALLRSTFSIDRLPTALSVFAAVIGASTAAGPIVGGLLVDALSWRWAFLINVPLGTAALLLGAAVLTGPAPVRGHRFDVGGTLLLAGALTGISYALVRGPEHSWTEPVVVVSGAVGAVCVGLFVAQESRCDEPLLPLRLFRNRNVSLGTCLTLLAFVSLVGSMFFLLLFLQHVRGMSPLHAGLMLLPMSILNVVGSSFAGFLTARYGPRPSLVGGMLLTTLGFLLLRQVDLDSDVAGLAAQLAVLGLGLGLVMTGSVQAVLANVSALDAGAAGGLHQTATQVGGILGTSALGAVMAAVVRSRLDSELIEHGVDPRALHDVPGLESTIAQGAVPAVPSWTPEALEALQAAAHDTFLSAMHATMLVGAGIALAGAVAAMCVTSNKTTEVDVVIH